jgi:hypothetical protein
MTPIFKTALLSLAPPRRTLRPAPPLSRTRLPLWRPQPRTRRSGAIQSREVEGGVEDWSWQGSDFFLHVRSSGRHGRARCCWKWAAQLSTGVRDGSDDINIQYLNIGSSGGGCRKYNVCPAQQKQ